ncbi:DoxX family protein [Propionicicella superfundia]|uniref:DoxX family protein n=1 Tax=Propionicicella superfundia TaxID=348582 RepID=UPI0004223420|nr:DoxX family protein [Propionicicella superfundia]
MQVLRDIALLFGRTGFGLLMIMHGVRRFFLEGMDAQTAYLQAVGLPQPLLFAYGAVVLEIVGGFLIVIGWLTPLVAAVFVVEFGLAIAWTTYFRGPWVADGGWEYHAALIAFALVLIGAGAGRASVDGARVSRRRRREEADSDLTS